MGCPTETEIGDNLVFSVCTHDPDTGVLTDAAAVPAYRIYEDETDPPILTGNMAKLDDDDTTGFYTESIACTAANGFENGKTYTVYITATVDGDLGGICYSFKAYDQRHSDVIQIGGNSVAGNAATLTLKQLDIQNNAGSAVIMGATGGNGHGLQISGNGTGEGISTTGGATGHGIEAIGGSTSGNGIYAYGQDGNGNGIECKGEATAGGTGSGLVCVASPAGNGITIAGGSTSGDGIHITATDGDGIDSASGGNNHGMRLTGAGTGEGLYSAGAAAGKGGILGISVDTTVNARTSDSVFTINAGSATNSCYVNMICAVYDVSGAVWECRKITGYVGAAKQVTVDTAFTFTIQAGTDLVRIIYDTYVLSGSGATVAQIWGADMASYTTQGQAGTYQQISGGRYG